MELIDVVHKLLGPIEPIGESNEDDRRLKNLEATIEVVDRLLCDIGSAAQDADRVEHSMRVIGQRAKQFLADVSTVN
jgi:hypothetical protein